MIKAVLFDLDGTLLDTVRDIHACVNETLEKFSYPAITLKETRAYIGNGAHKLIERALPKGAENLEACYADYRARFAMSDQSRTVPFDGALAFLNKLAERGLKLAVVTNKPQDATENCVKKFFVGVPFSFVGGDSGLFPVKPDPTLARYAALTMRVAPAECVFAGDGETDAQTAKNAGMCGVSCLWGYRTRAQLKGAGATRFAENFEDLGKIIEKIN